LKTNKDTQKIPRAECNRRYKVKIPRLRYSIMKKKISLSAHINWETPYGSSHTYFYISKNKDINIGK